MASDLAELIVQKARAMDLNEVKKEQMVIINFEDDSGCDHEFYVYHKNINGKNYVNCGQYDLLDEKGRKYFINYLKAYENSLEHVHVTELMSYRGTMYLKDHKETYLYWNHFQNPNDSYLGNVEQSLLKSLKLLLQIR
jgi:hypothetical protein